MTWYGWLSLGVIIGHAVSVALVVCAGRESHERGGTLELDSPGAREAFKHRRDAT